MEPRPNCEKHRNEEGRRASPRVSVILPTYNERGNIVPLIEEIMRGLAGRSLEVVVVDDNSPDGTAEAVRSHFTGNPDVHVLVRTADPGLANSIRHGIEHATGDLLVVMDTDFNHPPQHLAFMVEALRWYDCVSGSRYLFGGGMHSRARLTLSWAFNVFVRFVTAGKMTDNLYGFFAIRAPVLRRLDFDRTFDGYGDYFIRLLYYLQRGGASILQFPVMNGRRLSGTANSSFVATFVKYTATTLKFAAQERLGLGRPRAADRSAGTEAARESLPLPLPSPRQESDPCTERRQSA